MGTLTNIKRPEPKLRSLAKAISWRIFGSIITIWIGFIMTHQLIFALSIGAFEFVSKIIFFYVHERIWEYAPHFFHRKKSLT